MTDRDQAARFMAWLFGGNAPEETIIATSNIPLREKGLQPAFWQNNTSDLKCLVDAAIKAAASNNVYVGCCGLGMRPSKGRGTAEDVSVVTAVYADLDFGTGHKPVAGKVYPPDRDAVEKVIQEVGLPPSVLIHSGNGIQAWWLLDAPWAVTESTRGEAAAFVKRWVTTFQVVAARHGWALDSVGDLSRILRIPGTINHKTGKKPVRIILPAYGEPVRYARDHIAGFMVAEAVAKVPAATPAAQRSLIETVDPVLPRKDAGVPPIILAMCENDDRFKKTWNRKRSDLKDQSASAYDLSIATQLSLAGATDQDIADAILGWRTKHGEKPGKAQRRDYLMRTISKARTSLASVRAAEEIEEQIDEAVQDAQNEPSAAMGAQWAKTNLEKISKALGIHANPIVRVVKHGRESSLYEIELADGTNFHVGRAAALLSQDRFRAQFVDAVRIVLPRMKAEPWQKITQIIVMAAVETNDRESTRIGWLSGWLQQYTSEWVPVDADADAESTEWRECVPQSAPFIRKGLLHLNANALSHYLFAQGDRVNKQELRAALALLGFASKPVSVRPRDGRTYSRNYWVGPTDVMTEQVIDLPSGKTKTKGVK